ncbi:MAG: DoxX family protein [Deltaproteobacteria bacterium]|jgi:hypothetical protein|nr:DoxX family protein [Deltaproteobacteria bacterium]
MDKRRIAYWAVTAFFCLGMTGSGVMNLLRPPELLEGLAHLGFPAWFPLWLGPWKLAGVAVTLAPGLARLKEWAMAGFTIAMSSAFVAHLAAGDPFGQAFPPLVILGLGLTSWALRPENRRLAG